MMLLAAGDIKKEALIKGAVVFLIVLLCVVVLFFHVRSVNNQAQDIRLVTIPEGASTAEIAKLLVQEQVIRYPLLFRIVTRVKLLDNKLQAGEYEFYTQMSATQVLRKIVQGQTVPRSFTIPEGYTVEQIAALLAEKELVNREKFLQLARNGFPVYEYIRTDQNAGYAVEGFLFPDTYSIPKGMKEEDILNMMLKKFDTMLTAEMRAKAGEQGLDPYRLIILASLVEREARIEAERPVIAAVFLHRLQIEMPVQSCATIQYILGTPKQELTVQDTQIESPYNTYLHAGLPPGPIANPGLASILAVLNPAQTDVLYFVAKPDGAHIFSRTYEEHLQAIDQAYNVNEKER